MANLSIIFCLKHFILAAAREEVSMAFSFEDLWDPAYTDDTSSEYEKMKNNAQQLVRIKIALYQL